MEIKNMPTLETERLLLRKFTKDDMEALYSIYKDEEVNTYLPWFPLKSLKEAEAFFVEKYEDAYKQPGGYYYAICCKADQVPIGYINISPDKSHDLGYGLRKEFWRKGIATEAGKAVMDQAKKDGLPYVTATHDVNNPRSGNVMRQLGMQYRYSYEELWQPKNIPVTFRMYQINFDGLDDRVYRYYWDHSDIHFIEGPDDGKAESIIMSFYE